MNMYLKTVELIRTLEPLSDCAIGQYEACDHLGSGTIDFPTMVCRGDRTLLLE